jgi:hypothetical protein
MRSSDDRNPPRSGSSLGAVPLFRRSKPLSLPVPPKLAAERERARPKRILVIGSDGHGPAVRAYPWDKLPRGINVADYDVVLLNFAAFEEDPDLAEGFSLDHLPDRESLTRFLFAESGELIAMGDPSTLVGPTSKPGVSPVALQISRQRCDYWLPVWFGIRQEEGTSFQVVDAEWQFHFDALERYRWFITEDGGDRYPDPTRYLAPITREANGVLVRYRPIAKTRFGPAIAVQLEIQAVRQIHDRGFGLVIDYEAEPEVAVVQRSRPVFWLPAPDKVKAAEAIDQILHHRYGIATAERRPEWLGQYPLPAEEEVEAEIVDLEEQRSVLEERLREARGRAEKAAEPKMLLYEQGEERLEVQVRAALRRLGADVHEAEHRGIDDGTLRRQEGSAVLEIKGRSEQIKLADVRQIVHRTEEAERRDGIEYKPLIVGNAYRETRPEDRAQPLAPNASTYAEHRDVAVLTTVQIFEALQKQQSGEFDDEAFWAAVFAAKGVVELPLP